MAKPDLQSLYINPSTSILYRLKGKLGLAPVMNLDTMVNAADDTAAAAAGIAVGAIYRNGSVIQVRVT